MGGGVVGCAVARSLSRAGADVTLLESRECGSGASWAAAGMLSPYGEVSTPGPFQDLAVASMEEFPDFVQELESETGRTVRFTRCGKLDIAHSTEHAAQLKSQADHLARLDVAAHSLEASEVRDLEPLIDVSRITGALHVPHDAHVDNRALGRALADAAIRSGVDVHENCAVSEVVDKSGRCVGVRTRAGTVYPADVVVLAAGAETGRVRGIPRPLGVEPILGEMIAYDAPGQLTRMVHTDQVYIIQRGSRLLVGATMESGHTVARISGEARRMLMAGAAAVLPTLPDAPNEQWAGLRPGSPDGLPFLGPDPELPGLAHANGHFRNGILLTPATAAWAPTLIGQPPSSERLRAIDWTAFRVGR